MLHLSRDKFIRRNQNATLGYMKCDRQFKFDWFIRVVQHESFVDQKMLKLASTEWNLYNLTAPTQMGTASSAN